MWHSDASRGPLHPYISMELYLHRLLTLALLFAAFALPVARAAIPLPLPSGATSAADFQSPTLGTMKWIPAGTFRMGSANSESGRESDETQHSVTLSKGY